MPYPTWPAIPVTEPASFLSSSQARSILEYLEKIKLTEVFQRISSAKPRNSLFPVYRILLYLIVGWIVSCERIFHFRKLQARSAR